LKYGVFWLGFSAADRIAMSAVVIQKASDAGLALESAEFAALLDAQDELAPLRSKFLIPPAPATCSDAARKECIYLCGNSLGLQCANTRKYINDELDHWQRNGVEGHFTPPVAGSAATEWVTVDETVEGMMANVVGAKDGSEVVVMNSLTTNLHLMMVAFYRPKGARYKILLEGKAFPSDEHAFQSQVRFHGYEPEDALIRLAPREGEDTLRTEDITALLAGPEGASIATVLFSGVQYYTGQVRPPARDD